MMSIYLSTNNENDKEYYLKEVVLVSNLRQLFVETKIY